MGCFWRTGVGCRCRKAHLFNVSEGCLFPFLPGTLWACHICTALFSQRALPRSYFQGVSSILRKDCAPWSEEGQVRWIRFLCTEGSSAVCRCTAAWNAFPSTKRGRLHHRLNGVWVKKRMTGWTAWVAWRVGTAAGWLGLLKCKSSTSQYVVFLQYLRKTDLCQNSVTSVRSGMLHVIHFHRWNPMSGINSWEQMSRYVYPFKY